MLARLAARVPATNGDGDAFPSISRHGVATNPLPLLRRRSGRSTSVSHGWLGNVPAERSHAFASLEKGRRLVECRILGDGKVRSGAGRPAADLHSTGSTAAEQSAAPAPRPQSAWSRNARDQLASSWAGPASVVPRASSSWRRQSRNARWLSHKPVPSDPVNRIPVWRRTSLKVGVSRGFCCRRM